MSQPPFLGRLDEQDRFAHLLDKPIRDDGLPHVVLISGQGGMGKSTLLDRMMEMARAHQTPYNIAYLDWESERRNNGALRVDRQHIQPEVILTALEVALGRVDRSAKKCFKPYKAALKAYHQYQVDLEKVNGRISQGDSEFSAWAGKSVKWLISLMNKPTGEYTGGVTEAAVSLWREKVRAFLTTDTQIINAPGLYLARALADSVRKLTERAPLLVFLDTYEIVDAHGELIREVIINAGPRVSWIIAGRQNLAKGGQQGKGLRAYSDRDGRDYRLSAMELPELSMGDLCEFMKAKAPKDMPFPNDALLERLYDAVQGIPLAMELATEIWCADGDLEAVLKGDQPGEDIVDHMVARYLVHCVHEEDKAALHTLALAEGDVQVLRALLNPKKNNDFDLRNCLAALGRKYAAVHARERRLHDKPLAFLRHNLMIRAEEDWVRDLFRKADQALTTWLNERATRYTSPAERLADEKWADAVVRLAGYRFHVDSKTALPFFISAFLEGMAFDDAVGWKLRDAVYEKRELMTSGESKLVSKLNRWSFINRTDLLRKNLHPLEDLIRLNGWDGHYFDDGWDEVRRRIHHWLVADWLTDLEQWEQAKLHFERACNEDGMTPLMPGRKIGDTAFRLSFGLKNKLNRLTDAKDILISGSKLDKDNRYIWNNLGSYCIDTNDHKLAEEAFNNAITLDPNDAAPWHGLGNLFQHHLNRPAEAEAAYNKAIALDPNDAFPWHGLGNLFRIHLNRPADAEAAYKEAIALDPNLAYPWDGLGKLYVKRGLLDQAEAAFRKCVELGPEDPFCLNETAWFLMTQRRDLHKALKLSLRSVELSKPTEKYIYEHTLAFVLIRSEQWNEAVEPLEHYLRQASDTEIQNSWQQDVLDLFQDVHHLGKTKEALALLEAVDRPVFQPVLSALLAIESQASADGEGLEGPDRDAYNYIVATHQD